MTKKHLRFLGSMALAVAAGLQSSGARAAPPLLQLDGTAGCVSEDGTAGACVNGKALVFARDVVIAPDGSTAYVVAEFRGVAVFDRDQTTGALTQKPGNDGCVRETSDFDCADAVALLSPKSAAISPDGASLYVAVEDSDSVAIFDRDLGTGVITQKAGTAGCFSETGSSGVCGDGVGLDGARDVAVSPDGRNVYVAGAFIDTVAVFDRDPSTGALTQKGGTAACVSETGTAGACANGNALDEPASVVVSSDGRNVYVGTGNSRSIVVFDRDPSTGALTQKAGTAGCISESGTGATCVNGFGLDVVDAVTLSPNGRNLYAVTEAGDSIAIFDRDLATGALTQKGGTAGCVSDTGTGGVCADGVALDRPGNVVVSLDERRLYVASGGSDAIAVFDRDLSNGALTQAEDTVGCVSETGDAGACADGVALDQATGVAVSPNGRQVYATSAVSNAVAVLEVDDFAYDIDGNGEIDPFTDALLLIRRAVGFGGGTLISGAVDLIGCRRCTAPLIEDYMQAIAEP